MKARRIPTISLARIAIALKEDQQVKNIHSTISVNVGDTWRGIITQSRNICIGIKIKPHRIHAPQEQAIAIVRIGARIKVQGQGVGAAREGTSAGIVRCGGIKVGCIHVGAATDDAAAVIGCGVGIVIVCIGRCAAGCIDAFVSIAHAIVIFIDATSGAVCAFGRIGAAA